MKGTIEASVPNAIDELKNSVKEKAEHYTVVDLLRNDLSMVADWVKLDEFQKDRFFKTRNKIFIKMSSEISGKVKPEFQNKIGSLMKTLLPAGSILSAPKPKTLEIILEGKLMKEAFIQEFAVILMGKFRFLCDDSVYSTNGENLTFRSGGGITHLSKLADEYQEMKNKIYVPIH